MNTSEKLERFKILEVPFNGIGYRAALDILLEFLRTDKNHLVVTPNPEAVMLAQRNSEFLEILNAADLVLPDAIGIILAAKWLNLPINERVPGCDITQDLLKLAKNSSCYLLGAAPTIAEKAAHNLRQQGVNVTGFRDGYYTPEEEPSIIAEIQALKPDILILGMGMPRQENWAFRHCQNLPCKITLCVGGTIDIVAGNVKRAPKIMRKAGLEWLYRLATNPSRAKRMLDLPRFVGAVILRGKR
ncbi:MAG: WecB/TagA/CpsF family glycosyltransferase [Defluviitaleaceae bacterium]|nr:WecB/TagA/CpsF family glycosyltransferase [Defluviitaleaceae bacterium]